MARKDFYARKRFQAAALWPRQQSRPRVAGCWIKGGLKRALEYWDKGKGRGSCCLIHVDTWCGFVVGKRSSFELHSLSKSIFDTQHGRKAKATMSRKCLSISWKKIYSTADCRNWWLRLQLQLQLQFKHSFWLIGPGPISGACNCISHVTWEELNEQTLL